MSTTIENKELRGVTVRIALIVLGFAVSTSGAVAGAYVALSAKIDKALEIRGDVNELKQETESIKKELKDLDKRLTYVESRQASD